MVHTQTFANNYTFSTIITMYPLTPENINHILLLLDFNHSLALSSAKHILAILQSGIFTKTITQTYKTPLEGP